MENRSVPAEEMREAVLRSLPVVVRHAIHDLSQPLQAMRMMTGIAGVVVDDGRGIPAKLQAALEETEVRVAALQTLARALSDGITMMPREGTLADLAALCRRARPDLWRGEPMPRVVAPGRKVCVPQAAAAQVIAALLDNARAARPKTRILVGVRDGRIWVGDDGYGMATPARLETVLNARTAGPLGVGLSLSMLLVGAWGGTWRVRSREGAGTLIGFSLPGA